MITLSNFTSTHLNNTFLWMQNEELKDNFLLEKKITADAHQVWYQNMKSDITQKVYAIYHDMIHIGNIGLKSVDKKNKKAEVWLYIGETRFQGHGFGAEALLVLEKTIMKDIRKLYANVADFNIASIRTFLKTHYTIEGIFLDDIYFKGTYINILRFAKFFC